MTQRTIEITVAVPRDAKWISTDQDGMVCFWRRKPARRGGDWLEPDSKVPPAFISPSIDTGIPCFSRADSLRRLEGAGGETDTSNED